MNFLLCMLTSTIYIIGQQTLTQFFINIFLNKFSIVSVTSILLFHNIGLLLSTFAFNISRQKLGSDRIFAISVMVIIQMFILRGFWLGHLYLILLVFCIFGFFCHTIYLSLFHIFLPFFKTNIGPLFTTTVCVGKILAIGGFFLSPKIIIIVTLCIATIIYLLIGGFNRNKIYELQNSGQDNLNLVFQKYKTYFFVIFCFCLSDSIISQFLQPILYNIGYNCQKGLIFFFAGKALSVYILNNLFNSSLHALFIS